MNKQYKPTNYRTCEKNFFKEKEKNVYILRPAVLEKIQL
jgi:hypothetical protein